MTNIQIEFHQKSDELTRALKETFSFDDVQYEFCEDGDKCIVFVMYDVLLSQEYKGVSIDCEMAEIGEIIEIFKTRIMSDKWDECYTVHENTRLIKQIMDECGYTHGQYSIARNTLLYLFEAYTEDEVLAVMEYRTVTDLSDVKKIEIDLNSAEDLGYSILILRTDNKVISLLEPDRYKIEAV